MGSKTLRKAMTLLAFVSGMLVFMNLIFDAGGNPFLTYAEECMLLIAGILGWAARECEDIWLESKTSDKFKIKN